MMYDDDAHDTFTHAFACLRTNNVSSHMCHAFIDAYINTYDNVDDARARVNEHINDIEQRDVLRIMRELRAMKRDDNCDDIDTICNMLCDVFDM